MKPNMVVRHRWASREAAQPNLRRARWRRTRPESGASLLPSAPVFPQVGL